MDRYQFAVEWVEAAGNMLRSMQTEAPDISEKSGHQDIVTEYDREIERYLRGKIQNAFPRDSIVGEEFSGNTEECGEAAPAIWYLDPIDGTTNFVNQRCNYAVSVGCFQNGEMVFGIVLDVAEGHLYSARKGCGAWMNGNRLHTSGTRQIKDMLLTCPCITDLLLEEHRWKAAFSGLALRVRAVRSLGSVALELCQVASGKADICVAMKSAPWDHNAARLILQEAGGEIRSIGGEKLPYERESSFLAGNAEETLDRLEVLCYIDN